MYHPNKFHTIKSLTAKKQFVNRKIDREIHRYKDTQEI